MILELVAGGMFVFVVSVTVMVWLPGVRNATVPCAVPPASPTLPPQIPEGSLVSQLCVTRDVDNVISGIHRIDRDVNQVTRGHWSGRPDHTRRRIRRIRLARPQDLKLCIFPLDETEEGTIARW